MQTLNSSKEYIEDLNHRFDSGTAEDVLSFFIRTYRGKIAFASSLGAEDQVITKIITDIDPSTRIFMLDTGRLFPQTYQLTQKTNQHFHINIEIYFPDYRNVEQMVNRKGINLFYENIENRKECCHIRKIEPLQRAFSDLEVWISGLRNDQSVTRKDIKMIEWDDTNGLIKLNPIIHWSNNQVWEYIRLYNIPYNPLHDEGFPSIGCQPCTRAIIPGEDIRAGRWWWENPEHKECGLHIRRGQGTAFKD